MSATATKPKLEEYGSFDELTTLIGKFEQCTLSRSQWSHRAHLTVAFWYQVCYPAAEAVERVKEGIKKYNASQGIRTTKDGGYHETMTLFWVRMVQSFLAKNTLECSIVQLINTMTTLYANKDLPFRYYSRGLLMSCKARVNWVEPDLMPLP